MTKTDILNEVEEVVLTMIRNEDWLDEKDPDVILLIERMIELSTKMIASEWIEEINTQIYFLH